MYYYVDKLLSQSPTRWPSPSRCSHSLTTKHHCSLSLTNCHRSSPLSHPLSPTLQLGSPLSSANHEFSSNPPPSPSKLLPCSRGTQISSVSEEQPSGKSTHLTTSERHRQIRIEADKHYRRNAEKMKMQYSKKKRHQIKSYVVGDTVTVRIPPNERSSSDVPRLVCRVLEVKRNEVYRLE